MQHKFFEITRTPMVNMAPEGEDPILVADPEGETQVVTGCEICDMGLAEATASPNCMGMSLERMLEEG